MKTDWNLKLIYPSLKEWEDDFALLKERVEELGRKIDSCTQNKDLFSTFLNLKFETDALVEKVYCYSKRHLDLDSTLEEYKERLNSTLELHGILEKISSDFEKKIIENKEIILSYLEGELSLYTRYIEQILRKKEHLPKHSEVLEKYSIWENKIQTKYREKINEMSFKSVMVETEEKELNRTTYHDFLLHADSSVRREAFIHYTDPYKKEMKFLKDCYLEKLKNAITLSKEENYSSLLEKELFALELSPKILPSLIQKTNENIEVMEEYNAYKKETLGLSTFHVYDTSLSVSSLPKIEYTLEDAIQMIKNALSPLGEDYLSIVDTMFREGWIDIYPKENKRTMSFSCISYNGVPYILMNFRNDLSSVRTLGHEIGHSMNTYYSKKENPFVYFEFSMFLTEIASKVNEILVNEYLLKNSTSLEEKKYILNDIIRFTGSSLFGQMLLTEFEDTVIKEVEKGNNISVEEMNTIYLNMHKKYNGNVFTYDDFVQYDWLKVPHFIMQPPYYLYQYSIGTAIATNIASRILKEEEGIIPKYKKFLSIGSRVSIREALSYLDIDLENPIYMDHSYKVLKKKIEDLRKL